MSILAALQQGGQRSWRYKRVLFLVYALTLGLAAFLAYPLQVYLESKLGHSLMVEDMVKGFDYTLINDFLLAYGDGISPIMQQSLLGLGLYFLLMVFLQGGILQLFVRYPESYQSKHFWGHCAAYFWRMLRLSVYFWMLHAGVFVIFVLIFLASTKGLSPNRLSSDTLITTTLYWLVPLYTIVLAFCLMWQDYAKVNLAKTNSKWLFRPIVSAWHFIKDHIGKTYGLYLLNLSLLAIFVLINYWLTTAFAIHSTTTILLSFLLSQIFVLGRLFLRLVNQASVVVMFAAQIIKGEISSPVSE